MENKTYEKRLTSSKSTRNNARCYCSKSTIFGANEHRTKRSIRRALWRKNKKKTANKYDAYCEFEDARKMEEETIRSLRKNEFVYIRPMRGVRYCIPMIRFYNLKLWASLVLRSYVYQRFTICLQELITTIAFTARASCLSCLRREVRREVKKKHICNEPVTLIRDVRQIGSL